MKKKKNTNEPTLSKLMMLPCEHTQVLVIKYSLTLGACHPLRILATRDTHG